MAKSSFSLQQATADDVPTMAKIANDAFKTDRNTQVKTLGKDPNTHGENMSGALLQWLTKPDKCTVLKAVNPSTGEMAGWVCWGFWNGGAAKPGSVSKPKEVSGEEGGSGSVQQTSGEEAHRPSEEIRGKPELTGVALLKSITSDDMKRWMDIFMPDGTKCMYIGAITVAPAYQGHGVGSSMIRWGTSRADADGVYCWVHASEAGHRAFAKEGFEVVGTLEVDLDEYAEGKPEGEGPDAKWGKYTFRYMKRTPVK